MTEHHLPLRATLKAGRDYSDPWLTVDAANPDDLKFKLEGLAQSGALGLVVSVAQLLQGANNAAPIVAPPSAAPVQPEPTAPQAWGQPQAQNTTTQSVRLHPEGWACGQCNATLQYKEVFSKAKNKNFKFWSCPNNRSRDDGHRSEFAN